jgi:hypothetical protein
MITLYDAIEAEDVQTVSQVVNSDPRSVVTPFDSGNYPLHLACLCRSVPVVEVLLGGGADVNAVGSDGKTPLHCAVEAVGVEVVRSLLNRGANVNAVDSEGASVLAYAARGCTHPDAMALEEGTVLTLVRGSGAYYDCLSACYLCDLGRLQELIVSDATAVARFRDHDSMLHGVVFSGWTSEESKVLLLAFLFSHGLAVSKDYLREIIQSYTLSYGKSKLADYLVSRLSN